MSLKVVPFENLGQCADARQKYGLWAVQTHWTWRGSIIWFHIGLPL